MSSCPANVAFNSNKRREHFGAAQVEYEALIADPTVLEEILHAGAARVAPLIDAIKGLP